MSKSSEARLAATTRSLDERAAAREHTVSTEAEQAVLGGLLIDNSAIELIGDLAEDVFYSTAHRLIYSAIRKQAQAAKPFDTLTVAGILEASGELDDAQGLEYIGSLAQSVPSSANIRFWADLVRERAERRRLAALGAYLQSDAVAGTDLAELVARAREALDAHGSAGSFITPSAIGSDEWESARPTPDCVVRDFLYADVALMVAPGGMGKTTLKLYEAIHIALGIPLYGLTINKPGPVVILTAEDSREMLVARLRAIAEAMQLTAPQITLVMESVRISDVSGSGLRLTAIMDDVVRPSNAISEIIRACQTLKPVLVVIDPAVSFGVGESRVNDAEQGLIEAGRKLRGTLNCCVQFIHHTGKQNAREKAVDQYAGRGGSAFADGARMVHVLQSLTPGEWREQTGQELLEGETGLRLARPKMSYCSPVGDIFVCRSGFAFRQVHQSTVSVESKVKMAAAQIWQLLTSELSEGRRHTQNTLEQLDTGLTRAQIRGAVSWLVEAEQRVEYRDMPNAKKGGSRRYLHPLATPAPDGAPIEKTAKFDGSHAAQKTAFAAPPPIGNSPAAHQPPPGEPP